MTAIRLAWRTAGGGGCTRSEVAGCRKRVTEGVGVPRAGESAAHGATTPIGRARAHAHLVLEEDALARGQQILGEALELRTREGEDDDIADTRLHRANDHLERAVLVQANHGQQDLPVGHLPRGSGRAMGVRRAVVVPRAVVVRRAVVRTTPTVSTSSGAPP
eukprot:602285-Prymnesium_polylepis.2